MRYAIKTDIGRRRPVNEDSAAVFEMPEGPVLAVVADGMGGHKGGDFASLTAVRVIGEQFMQAIDARPADADAWAGWLHEVVTNVNSLIYRKAKDDRNYRGMGTTLDAVLIDGSICSILHIGDSRVYKISPSAIQQVTRDHSFVNALLDSGEITEEEAVNHPKRNWIMRALGSEKTINPDCYTLDLEPDCYLLICTDGLTNKVDDATLQKIILSPGELSEKAERLIDLANGMGGEDNITVILWAPSHSEVSSNDR